MVEALLTLPYSQLYGHDYSFYSVKQLDTAYQKLIKFISTIPQFSVEECIPFNQKDELVWIPNQQIKDFITGLHNKHTHPFLSNALLQQGAFSIFMHVVSQLLITKIRIQLYKSSQTGLSQQFSKIENEINIFGARIITTLESLKEIEERIKQYLRNNPVIHTFENLYQKAVKAQHDGNLEAAKSFAAELNQRKSKYILATKVIQNDMTVFNQYHLNIQLILKSILTTEKMVMDKKNSFLSDRMQNLNQTYTEEMNTHQREQIVEMLKDQIELVNVELSSIKQRSEVIVIQENQINQTLKQLQSPSQQVPAEPYPAIQDNPNTWTTSKMIMAGS